MRLDVKQNLREHPAVRLAAEELQTLIPHAPWETALRLDPALPHHTYRIVGNAGQYTVWGSDENMLLHGVYHLLRRGGCRFFSPDPWDTEIPEKVQTPDLDVTCTPPFELRGFFGVEKRDTPEFLRWMARNSMNFWTQSVHHPEFCRQAGFQLVGNPPAGMHRLFAEYLPPERYFASHPEYYGLIRGERRADMSDPHGKDNICFANRDALEEVAKNLIRDLLDGALEQADLVRFASFDNGNWCTCSGCREMGNPMARLLHAAAIASRRIRERVPRPVKLVVPAYHETLTPPDVPLPEDFDYENIFIELFPIERCYAHAIDDPACPPNAQLAKLLQSWAEWKKFRLICCEYYNVSTFASLAIPLDEGMAHDLEFYRKCGVTGMHYMHVSTARWGELAMTNCAFAAACRGEAFSPGEFCRDRYGDAAETMEQFYTHLRQAMANAKAFRHYLGNGFLADGVTPARYKLTDLLRTPPARPEDYFLPGHLERDRDCGPALCLPTVRQKLQEADALLARAEKTPGLPERMNRRLRMDRERFDYTRLAVELLALLLELRLAEMEGNPERARHLAGELRPVGEALEKMTDVTSHLRAPGAPSFLLTLYANALNASECADLYREYMAKYFPAKELPFPR